MRIGLDCIFNLVHLILGYLGFSNYGDELLASIVETHLGENCPRLSRKNSLWEHLRFISQSKVLIGVGGLFQDSSSRLSPWYYFLIILYAYLSNKRIVLLAQGIGPLRTPLNKFITYVSFKLANSVSVRDASSSKLLTQLKIKHHYGSDLAWSLANTAQHSTLNAQRSKVIVSIRETKEPIEKITNALKDLLLDCDSEPVFLIMEDSDELFTQKIMEELQLSAEIIYAKIHNPDALIDLLRGNFTTMISMRLHALILAHIAGLELRAIVCDPKLDEVLLQIQEYELPELAQRAKESLSLV